MQKHVVHPSLVEDHKRLSRFKYPVTYFDTKLFTLPEKSQHVISETIWSGKLPQRIFVGLVDTASTGQGKLTKDPFCFEDFGVQSVKLVSDDHYRQKEIKVNDGDFLACFLEMTKALGDLKNGIDRKSFSEGNVFFVFELVPRVVRGFQIQHIGQIKFQFSFSKELTSPVTVVVFGQKEGLIEIDGNKNVYTDSL